MREYFYNLGNEKFRVLGRSEMGCNVTYLVESIESPARCPRCNVNNYIRHGVNRRKVRDLNEFGYKVGIIINGHRYQCLNCGKTWVDKYKAIDSSSRMTNRMRAYVIANALRSKFSVVAEELGISVTIIEKLLIKYVDELDLNRQIEAPKVLGMDETRINGVL